MVNNSFHVINVCIIRTKYKVDNVLGYSLIFLQILRSVEILFTAIILVYNFIIVRFLKSSEKIFKLNNLRFLGLVREWTLICMLFSILPVYRITKSSTKSIESYAKFEHETSVF